MKHTKSLLPNIILSVILVVIFFVGLTVTCNANSYNQNQVQTSLLSEQVVYPTFSAEPIVFSWIETDDVSILEGKIKECENRKKVAHQLAENARYLGYGEESPVIELAKDEWAHAHHWLGVYSNQVAELTPDWLEKENEYYYATKVWQYLHDCGYNDWVSAGIIGNMMAECGGQTLDLQVTIDNGSHYGICQWSHYYYPEVNNTSFEYQCEFLGKTIESELNSFGSLYKQGFDYSDFCSLTDERQAAAAFALCYERCGSGSYKVRQDNAEKAYQYFVG